MVKVAAKKKKISERGKLRAERIAAGLCGTCGKRKLYKDRKECRHCLEYFRAWAKARQEAVATEGTE